MRLVPRPTPPPVTGLRATPMPFGPFNGRPVCELPDYYLLQLANKRLWPSLAAAVDAELEFRTAVRAAERRVGRRAA